MPQPIVADDAPIDAKLVIWPRAKRPLEMGDPADLTTWRREMADLSGVA